MGTYDRTWNKEAQIAASSTWYEIGELSSVLATLKRNGFNTQESRNANIGAWGGLRGVAPFSHNVRFPPFSALVGAFRGDWPDKARQLELALQFKGTASTSDPLNTGGETGGFTRSKSTAPSPAPINSGALPDVRGFDKYEDALVSFYWSIAMMERQISAGDQLFDQSSFEKAFYLEWVADRGLRRSGAVLKEILMVADCHDLHDMYIDMADPTKEPDIGDPEMYTSVAHVPDSHRFSTDYVFVQGPVGDVTYCVNFKTNSYYLSRVCSTTLKAAKKASAGKSSIVSGV